MGDLSETRIGTVRRLLEYAPDTAVHSLDSLMASDGSIDLSAGAIRELVRAERADRRLRDAVFSPLAAIFRQTGGGMGLRLPADIPVLLWRALKSEDEVLIDQAADAFMGLGGGAAPDVSALDAVCLQAAQDLHDRIESLEPISERLASNPQDLTKLITLLRLAPLLRRALAQINAWVACHTGEHDPAIRALWNAAGEVAEDGGVLFIEALFAHLDQSPQILRLISVVMDRPTDRLFAICEYASFGERLLAQIDAQIDTARRFDPGRGLEGGVAVASASATAHAGMSAFENSIVLAKEGVWGARIAAQRRSLALAMEMRLREVEPAVAAALPAVPIRVSGKLMRGPPDLSRPSDQRLVDRAVALLALLEGSRTSAAMAGFGALRLKVLETLGVWLESYVLELLDRLHKRDPQAGRIRDYLDIAAEFVSMVRTPEAADIIRRRTAAA